ncbi:Metallo-dependent phosphatase-like protein [Russula dissimulans]|nr:Metallo-dependent phosphatase-like protein [Russula dissimulans]
MIASVPSYRLHGNLSRIPSRYAVTSTISSEASSNCYGKVAPSQRLATYSWHVRGMRETSLLADPFFFRANYSLEIEYLLSLKAWLSFPAHSIAVRHTMERRMIDDEVLCAHPGLSPDIRTLDQIRVLSRAQEIPHEGAFCDDIKKWVVSPHCAGWLFGGSVTREFGHVNSLVAIARAHQFVQEGYKYISDEALATMWSAPNYCYFCGNMAGILTFGKNGARSFAVYWPR